MNLAEKFKQEALQADEKILLEDTIYLGQKAWTGWFEFSSFDSTIYITNSRVAIVTPKPPALLRVFYKALTAIAASSFDVPEMKLVGKHAVNLNFNEGNVLIIPFDKIVKAEVRNKIMLVVPAGVIVLNFLDGSILPMMFMREAGAGAERWNAEGRARAISDLIHAQKKLVES